MKKWAAGVKRHGRSVLGFRATMTAFMSDETRVRRDLTAASLAQLLDSLSPAPAEAAERYNSMRARLTEFFRWRQCQGPEDLADEVVNRVARRISEGEQIANLPAYFLSVARLVAMEARERSARESRKLDEYARHLRQMRPADGVDDALVCLDRCLTTLSPERREQLLTYYIGGQAARIERRRQLAQALDVAPVALRNRMLRMRQRLESCLDDCLSTEGDRDESLGRDTESRGRRERDERA